MAMIPTTTKSSMRVKPVVGCRHSPGRRCGQDFPGFLKRSLTCLPLAIGSSPTRHKRGTFMGQPSRPRTFPHQHHPCLLLPDRCGHAQADHRAFGLLASGVVVKWLPTSGSFHSKYMARPHTSQVITSTILESRSLRQKSKNGIRAAFLGQYRRLFLAIATFVGRIKVLPPAKTCHQQAI